MPFSRSVAVLMCAAALAPAQDVLRTLAGKSVTGTLQQIDDDKIVLRTNEGIVATPIGEVMQLDLEPAVSAGGVKFADVELLDGSVLHCKELALKGKDVELTMLPDMAMKLPLAKVRAILRVDAQDPKIKRDWDEFRTKLRGNRDHVVIMREGVLNGLEGTIGDADPKGETIDFESTSGRQVNLSLSRVHGMIFYRKPDPQAPVALGTVTDVHRNTLVAASIKTHTERCVVTTVSGLTVTYSSPRQLHRVDFHRLTYLSDLSPVQLNTDPERAEGFIRDKNLDNGILRLLSKNRSQAVKAYPKGLLVFPPSVLTYQLNGEFKDFKAVLGIDAQYSGKDEFTVNVRFEGDGRELLVAEVKNGSEPTPISFDLQQVKELKIVVRSDLGDRGHVVLADAKMSK